VKGFLEEHGIPDMKNNILEELMSGRIPEEIITASIVKGELDRHFEDYLLTGGIPAVVDAYHTRNKIPTRYYSLYLNATIGDVKRSRLRETYFKQVASRVLKSISDPISWESVTRTTDIKHHETVAQYMETLEALYIANVTLKVNADGRPSIRSNKKVYFQDPFITHSLQWWMKPAENPLVLSREWVLDPVRRGHLVEGVVNDHLIRYSYDTYPSDLFDAKDFVFYYRTKSGKEIDFILNRNTGLYPIEVKYRRKANGYDLIPLRSFGRGLVLTRNTLDVRKGFVHIPVSMFLMLI
jgi:predicted AAA+ superfamily ATPase